MDRQPRYVLIEREPPTPADGSGRWFGRAVAAVLAIALVYTAVRYLAFDLLDEEIRSRIETKFREHYKGLKVSLRAARRVPGRGIEFRGLVIAHADHRDGQPPMIAIDELFAECDTELADFVTQEPRVRRVVVRRAALRATRFKSGFWDTKHLFPLVTGQGKSPPITIVGGTVTIVDETCPGEDPFVLRDVRVDFQENASLAASLGIDRRVRARDGRAPRAPQQFQGVAAGDHFKRIEIRGAVDLERGVFDLEGEAQDVLCNPQVRSSLPADIAKELNLMDVVQGRVQSRFHASNVGGSLRYTVDATIADGKIAHEKLPESLTDIVAKIHADNEGVKVEKFSARFGSADVRGEFQIDGYGERSPWTLSTHIEGLRFTEQLAAALPQRAQSMWRRFRPTGVLTGDTTLTFDGETIREDLSWKASELSYVYSELPYRLSGGAAALELHDDVLTINGMAYGGDAPISFQGEIHQPGPDWHGWLQGGTDELVVVDDKLIDALKPDAQALVRRFNPRGHIRGGGRLQRRAGERPILAYDVELVDCAVKYESFPYPIDAINGSFHVVDGAWTFENLRGGNGAASIACEGRYGPAVDRKPSDAKPRLRLDFDVTGLELDEDLRRALDPGSQRLWADVRPRGKLDVIQVQVDWAPGEERAAIKVDARKAAPRGGIAAEPIHVSPTWFPYGLAVHRGAVSYRDGRIQFQEVEATHGRTSINAAGECTVEGLQNWSVRFDKLSADRLTLDHDLLSSLPTEAERALSRANFSGLVSVAGTATVRRQGADAKSIDANWDLRFDVQDGRVGRDVPLEHVHGGVHLVGEAKAGRWHASGDVQIDSMLVHDVQLTDLRGPLYVDDKQAIVGSWADRERATGQPRRMTTEVFGGLALLDGKLALDEEGRFELATSLEEADLAQIGRDVKGISSELKGRAFALLKMQGNTRGKHTWHGSGDIRLRDADMYEVPALVAVLKLLSIRRPDSTAFTSCDIDFRLHGDDLAFDRVDLSGDAVSLKGHGHVLEWKYVDLKLYTQMGRSDDRLAIMRPLRDSGPAVMLIDVTGTLEQPRVKKTAFPAINETLQALFPELGASGSLASKQAKDESKPPPPPPKPAPATAGGLWNRMQSTFRR